jgi:hypothetical protein
MLIFSGAEFFGEMFKVNKTLHFLVLSGNNISKNGIFFSTLLISSYAIRSGQVTPKFGLQFHHSEARDIVE